MIVPIGLPKALNRDGSSSAVTSGIAAVVVIMCVFVALRILVVPMTQVVFQPEAMVIPERHKHTKFHKINVDNVLAVASFALGFVQA